MHFKRIEHFSKIPRGLSGGLSFQLASVQFLIKERLRFKQDLNMDHFLSQLFIKLFLNTQRSTGLLFCDYDVFRIPTVSISCVSSPE